MPPLNNNVTPIIQQSSPLGEVLHYQVTGPDTLSLTDLRTLQDWVIGRRLKTVAGVVQVNSWGGTTKQLSIDVDQMKLEAHRVTIVEIVKALENANINVGGREISIGQQSINIRGIGMIDDGGATDLNQRL
jgi:cobalt-zinc-cadmium resistance protein CzcA